MSYKLCTRCAEEMPAFTMGTCFRCRRILKESELTDPNRYQHASVGSQLIFGATQPPAQPKIIFEGVWTDGYRPLTRAIKGKRIRIEELPYDQA